ncbi:hypothetical protein ABPG74_012239 [Tetrahymena malaccensis]
MQINKQLFSHFKLKSNLSKISLLSLLDKTTGYIYQIKKYFGTSVIQRQAFLIKQTRIKTAPALDLFQTNKKIKNLQKMLKKNQQTNQFKLPILTNNKLDINQINQNQSLSLLCKYYLYSQIQLCHNQLLIVQNNYFRFHYYCYLFIFHFKVAQIICINITQTTFSRIHLLNL